MIDVAPIILSCVAIAVSVLAFAEGRRRYKRDLFLKIHEMMISADLYRGRQLLLSQQHNETTIENLPHNERANISRAIGAYDTLGLYLKNKNLREADVLSMWGDPAVRAWRAAQPFVTRRSKRSRRPAYPYFQYLAMRAEAAHPEP